MTMNNNTDIQALSNMSIAELKQLLSCVNQDLKSIKRAEKIAANNQPSEYDIANSIAKRFTGNKQVNPVQNAKLKADIQIQKDILDYLNNGGRIITAKPRKSRKYSSKSFVVALSNKITL
jgi:Zn-dependent M16 (insulinase) family peptidase